MRAAARPGIRRSGTTGPVVIFSDDFIRADANTLGTTPVGGGTWTPTGGTTFGIRSNAAVDVARSLSRSVLLTCPSGDGIVTCVLPTLTTGPNGGLGPTMRDDGSQNNYVQLFAGSAGVGLYTAAAGLFANPYVTATVPSTPCTLELTVVGPPASAIITAKVNGTTVYSGTPVVVPAATITTHGMNIPDDITQATNAKISHFDYKH